MARERVTWVQQLPWLADTTVRENLRIADPEADDDTLIAALDAVRLDAWLGLLPEGLDTRIGRGGSAMSGGEVQRLALARVLLGDHRVVVLDEPTANLDPVTADAVLTPFSNSSPTAPRWCSGIRTSLRQRGSWRGASRRSRG